MSWTQKSSAADNKLETICEVAVFSYFAYVSNSSQDFCFVIVLSEHYNYISSIPHQKSETISNFISWFYYDKIL